MYSKERTGLTQQEALENMGAVFRSPHFGSYNCSTVELSSDVMHVELQGVDGTTGGPVTVSEIADVVTNLLSVASTRGDISKARIELRLSDAALRGMEFQRQVYEEDFNLPLVIEAHTERTQGYETYRFHIVQSGLNKSYFEEQGWNYQDAKKKIDKWYGKISRALKRALPHPFQRSV